MTCFCKLYGICCACLTLVASAGACTAHVTEQRLNAGDEHLVIATQGFWDVVSADDSALLMHFHLKVGPCQASCAAVLVSLQQSVDECNTTFPAPQSVMSDSAKDLSLNKHVVLKLRWQLATEEALVHS